MKVLLPVLFSERQSWRFRYGATLFLVLVAFLVRLALERYLHEEAFLLFVPLLVIVPYLFDRGTGYLATALSAALAGYFFVEPRETFAFQHKLVPLAIYVATGCAAAVTAERLRAAVRKLERSEAQMKLLLDELSHRARNNLMMVASMLSLQARAIEDPAARAALDSTVARVNVIARAQERLRPSRDHTGRVEISGYLETICLSLGDLLRDVRPIAVRVHAPKLDVPESLAVAIGLMTNELVTNAFKYAYPDERGGTIDVRVARQDAVLTVTVEDDGVGYPSGGRTGMGSRLISLLAAQQGGRVERESLPKGCRVSILLPFAAERNGAA